MKILAKLHDLQRQQCKDREDPMVQREASIAAEFGCRKAGP